MRINKWVALATGLSRRKVDSLVEAGEILVNQRPAHIGQDIAEDDAVHWKGTRLKLKIFQTICLHKPVGYVCSRDGQGSQTIYDLLPASYQSLKPVGRLDKESSGLLVLTNDGDLANQLTHPSHEKTKVYEVTLNKSLAAQDQSRIEQGIQLQDGLSKLRLTGQDRQWTVTMSEGRNRQIRRTLEAAGYQVSTLHRIQFGQYKLDNLRPGSFVGA